MTVSDEVYGTLPISRFHVEQSRHSMIYVHFSPGEGCNISGTPTELRAVGSTIFSLDGMASFAADTSQSPAPYEVALSALDVCVGAGPVRASVQGSVLSITAAPEFLKSFASFFEFEGVTTESYHVHHEYFPGNPHISPESVPLIISACHTQP